MKRTARRFYLTVREWLCGSTWEEAKIYAQLIVDKWRW